MSHQIPYEFIDSKTWTNPSFPELSELSPLVTVATDNKAKNVSIIDFNLGHHADVSLGLKHDDSFNSLDFLKKAAEKKDNLNCETESSNFLQFFVGRLISE